MATTTTNTGPIQECEGEGAGAIGAPAAEAPLAPPFACSGVRPVTMTFWNVGAPPPLRTMDARSLFMVRTFTSGGGGGAPGIF